LAETKYGLIKIGWRKRIISIEWPKEAEVHGKNVKSNEESWITDWENGVHTYGWAKAVEYLGKFAELADRVIFNREANARLTADELKEFQELTNLNNPPARRSPLEEQRYQTLYKKWRGSN
jgi:hypothetical protein